MAREKNLNGSIYRLAVPTGLGKTLSSLRFAIARAKMAKKDHIFYIAPFDSILEQKAREIRKIVGNENILEHHCNIVVENEDKEEGFKKLKNWESAIIATSAVQFLKGI